MQGTRPNGTHPLLHAKPLDVSLGECPCSIAPVAAIVNDFKKNKKNTNKTQLLPSFLTVDQRKKAKQF
jgi:hypothetical protein